MSRGPRVFVGLDLGTSGARAFAVAADGAVLGRGAQPLHSRRDGVRHEQDPAGWWKAAATACREALRAVRADRVDGIAVCGTSGTVLLVDGDGRPRTPALMYDDRRASAQAGRLGVAPSSGLAKLHWLLEHERPGAVAAGRLRLAHEPDVVTRRLVGHDVASDASHALKSGYDAARATWAPTPTRMPGGVLPDVVTPGTRLGEVCAEAAGQTGLPAGTPVVAGMTDGCAAQIAACALRAGDCNSVLGTTLVLKGCAAQRVEDPAHGIYSHRSPDGDWWPGGASSSGAGVLPATFPGRDLDALDALAAPHERTRVLAYPLVSRGERFPFVAPDAEAFVLGSPQGDGEHVAALLQGLALVERLCLQRLGGLGVGTGGQLSLTGGAARNRRLCQLRADALGRSVRLPEQTEPAFGMAILAASAAAPGETLAAVAQRMSRTREVLEPRDALREHFDEQHARFAAELRRRGWLDGGPAERGR